MLTPVYVKLKSYKWQQFTIKCYTKTSAAPCHPRTSSQKALCALRFEAWIYTMISLVALLIYLHVLIDSVCSIKRGCMSCEWDINVAIVIKSFSLFSLLIALRLISMYTVEATGNLVFVFILFGWFNMFERFSFAFLLAFSIFFNKLFFWGFIGC